MIELREWFVRIRGGWLLALPLVLGACTPAPLIVPSTDGDHRPHLTITNGLFGDGTVDKADVETIDSCTAMGGCAFPVFATRYTKVQLSGKASDPIAGIKSLSVTVTQAGQVLYSVQSTNVPDASGKVPSEMGFIGTDNAGGFGVVKPIEFVVSNYVTVTVDATNFENHSNRLVVEYQPQDPVQASISFTPSQIDRGQIATLNISGSPQSSLSIQPPVAIVPYAIGVSPPVTTTYTLTVTQMFPTATASFPNPPPATGAVSHPTSKSVSATLTVKQPPMPTANPAQLLFYLQLQPLGLGGTNAAWTNTFGVAASGAVTAIENQGPYDIELIADGSTSDDCFSGSTSTVKLAPHQTTTAAELAQLYGTNTGFPRPMLACAYAGASPPPLLAVNVTYTH